MTLPTWHNLNCRCGADQFLSFVHIRFHPTGGTSTEPGGWQCAKCGKSVDMAMLIQDAKLKQKKEEVRLLTEEINEAQKGKTT